MFQNMVSQAERKKAERQKRINSVSCHFGNSEKSYTIQQVVDAEMEEINKKLLKAFVITTVITLFLG